MPLTSFYTALTGINTNSMAINVIGDNVANMNTTAFKASKATFSELLSGLSGTSATGNPTTYGLGSTPNGISRNDTQGTINNTGQSTDAAINGNGFFVVTAGDGMAYTRSGEFEFNKEGYFVSADGFQVLGYPAVDGEIDTSAAPAAIVIKKGQSIAGSATENMSINANLDAEASNGTLFSTSVQVYDSLGASHDVKLTFAKTAAIGEWSWSATMSAAETTGGSAGDPPIEMGTGTVIFDNAGNMTAPATNPTLSISGFSNGAASLSFAFNLLDDEGNGLVTGYASDSAVSTTAQDGIGASVLTDITISSDGVIMGLTENGQSVPLAQLAIATFQNVEGLQKYQGSTFTAFSSAGEPSVGVAGTAGRGTIVGSALEKSNVDMAQEFISLIVAQRAYQANSRVITTTDELYQDALNLKR
jgi:flagellar hook protein FlgE